MNRFWSRYIEPMMLCLQPHRILEIGADAGHNTRHILRYCQDHQAFVDIVDPAPQPSLHQLLADMPGQHRYHPIKSIAAIPQLSSPDLALIDGDHNWATVYSELDLLHQLARRQRRPLPVMVFHDVGWPYARRDMYYLPDEMDASQKHPYAYKGMLPGVGELVENGMNGVLANALHEGGPRNGVLTAIEDFLQANPGDYRYWTLPFFNGLGVLVPEDRLAPPLLALIEQWFSADSLLEACKALETDSMHVRAMLAHAESVLTRRTEALERARQLLDAQARRIAELEQLTQTTPRDTRRVAPG